MLRAEPRVVIEEDSSNVHYSSVCITKTANLISSTADYMYVYSNFRSVLQIVQMCIAVVFMKVPISCLQCV